MRGLDRKRAFPKAGTFTLKIGLPAFLVLAAFTVLIFVYILPYWEKSYLSCKTEIPREVAEVARDTLAEYNQRAQRGELSLQKAQELAKQTLYDMRYGPDDKDYLWINDDNYRLIMHPYRPDLVGKDLRNFQDPSGKYIFRNFVDISREKGEGFSLYQWQWKDDPTRIVPKISYVKGFKPWGWTIGTGVYVNDVLNEIADAKKKLAAVCATILLLTGTMTLFITWQSIQADRRREKLIKALADSRRKLRAIFDQTFQFMGMLDTNGTLLEANDTSLETFQLKREDVINKPFWDTPWWSHSVEEQNKLKEAVRRAVEGETVRFVSEHPLPGGEMRIMDVSIKPVLTPDGETAFLIPEGRDITERRRQEENLKRLNEELEERVAERTQELREANAALQQSMETLRQTQRELVQSEKMAALGELIAGVAHEINTPVGIGITASSYFGEQTEYMAELMERGEIKRSGLAEYLRLARESSEIILANLNQAAELIQSFKQVAVDQSTDEARKFNLKEYLEEILMHLGPKYKRTKHQIHLDCPEDIVIVSSPGAFMQILTNLIVNSLMHGFENIDEGRIIIRAMTTADTLHLDYFDNGKGMSQAQVAKIFDPFFTTKRGRGGTGLGMHIVYNLVTQTLKGQIECQSAPGEGTTFKIRIPLPDKRP